MICLNHFWKFNFWISIWINKQQKFILEYKWPDIGHQILDIQIPAGYPVGITMVWKWWCGKATLFAIIRWKADVLQTMLEDIYIFTIN